MIVGSELAEKRRHGIRVEAFTLRDAQQVSIAVLLYPIVIILSMLLFQIRTCVEMQWPECLGIIVIIYILKCFDCFDCSRLFSCGSSD